MTLDKNDKLELFNHCLKVNGIPFVVDNPNEVLYGITQEGKLETFKRGKVTVWENEDIDGYWA